jgi:hypothetical protein
VDGLRRQRSAAGRSTQLTLPAGATQARVSCRDPGDVSGVAALDFPARRASVLVVATNSFALNACQRSLVLVRNPDGAKIEQSGRPGTTLLNSTTSIFKPARSGWGGVGMNVVARSMLAQCMPLCCP